MKPKKPHDISNTIQLHPQQHQENADSAGFGALEDSEIPNSTVSTLSSAVIGFICPPDAIA